VAAWNPDGDWKVPHGYWAMPDFVTAFALTNQVAARCPQQFSKRTVKLGAI